MFLLPEVRSITVVRSAVPNGGWKAARLCSTSTFNSYSPNQADAIVRLGEVVENRTSKSSMPTPHTHTCFPSSAVHMHSSLVATISGANCSSENEILE